MSILCFKIFVIVYSSLVELAEMFPFVEEDAEYEWPMNREVEQKIKNCATEFNVDVRSLDEFILDNLCFEIPDESMALSKINTFPCQHAKNSSRC